MVSSLAPHPAERILEAAEKKFLRTGFQRVSMDELASELGMSKKTLYTHFPSKQTLVEAMLARRVARTGAAMDELLATPMGYCERLGKMAHLIHEKLSEVSPHFVEDIRRHAPQSFQVIEDFRSGAIPRFFGQLIDEGIASGDIDPTVDRELVIRMILVCIQGIVRPESMAAHNLTPLRALDGILAIFFRGILTPHGRTSCEEFFKTS